jgi:hypothetical protein
MHGSAFRTLFPIRDVLGEEPPVLVQPRVKEGNAAKQHIGLLREADVLVVVAR